MKKAIFIAMAALVLLTAQCKKNEPKPEEKVMVPITGTVDFGGGSKTEITTAGYITPVAGDKIYIYNAGTNVGSMTCTRVIGQQFECSGEIVENCLGKTCTFMYLGTGSTDADGNLINDDNNGTSISFANQTSVSVSNDDKIANLNKFHVGSCIADVSEAGTVTLPMLSKMSIAYFKLTTDVEGNSPIAGQEITISGLSATATINKADGTLTGSDSGDITVKTGEDGSFYMALIPHSGSVTFTFKGSGYIDATTTFANGIRPCCFYSEQGLGNPLKVTMKPAKFTVGMNGDTPITVEFAPGNLWYGKADGEETAAFHFEANQWDYSVGEWNESEHCHNWNLNHVSHFKWSDASNAVSDDNCYSGNLFCDKDFTVTGDGHTDWRTLSKAEWNYLLGTGDAGTSSRTNASSLRALKELDGHIGLVILPDGTDASVMNSITSTSGLAAHGAVFLPYAGRRDKNNVTAVGSHGYYWSSTQIDSDAYYMDFDTYVTLTSGTRGSGYAVRLVRYL